VVEERVRKAKGGSRSALVDPAAKQRLEVAAEAAGLDLEGLVNLVVDSGAIALPPTDGVTETYTVEDLGAQMHSQMPSQDREQWFADLVDTQQIALIALLRARGYSSIVIARDFGVTNLSVNKIYSRYADDLGAQVINVRLNTLVGNLQLAAERAGEGSMSKEDWSTYWRIQKEMIALLQSLGIVKQAIRKVEVAHKFDDQKAAELSALLDLERKQVARREEMNRADVTITDAVPQLALPAAPGSMEEPYVEE
jgi:hypothetical protein